MLNARRQTPHLMLSRVKHNLDIEQVTIRGRDGETLITFWNE